MQVLPYLQQVTAMAYFRRMESPVYFEPSAGAYVVTRHEDILAVLNDSERFSSREALGPGLGRLFAGTIGHLAPREALYLSMPSTLVCSDGEHHARLRKPTNRAFAPAMVQRLEPRISEICQELSGGFDDGRPREFMAQFARPLAVRIMAEIFGVPREDYPDFLRRIEGIVAISRRGEITPELTYDYLANAKDFVEYLKARITGLRESPDSSLLSAMATELKDSPMVTGEHLVRVCFSIVVAAHETTSHMLSSAVLRLAADPCLLAAVRADLAARVAPFIEEILRLDSPVQRTFRTATREVSIGGVSVPSGSHVMLCCGAGNRDHNVFDEADRLDLNRPTSPKHLSFGHGPHVCLGASLARLEGCAAVRALLSRFRQISHEGAVFDEHAMSRGPRELYVTFSL